MLWQGRLEVDGVRNGLDSIISCGELFKSWSRVHQLVRLCRLDHNILYFDLGEGCAT